MRIAFVFPGATSHRAGALASWHGHPATDVLDEVVRGCGRDVAALADGPSTIGRTADAQAATLACCLVAWRALADAGIAPDVVAGHGLGEVTAAVTAGVLTVRGGAALAAARGVAMAAACAQRDGGMAAVLRLGDDAIEVIVDGIDDAVIAHDDAPGQVVVAGPPPALRQLREVVRFAGGRVVPLPAEGAFHSPAMAAAVPQLAATLASLRVHDPRVPLVSGATAIPLRRGTDVADALAVGIGAPVRWREVQARLLALGVTDLVEVGPGGVLAGLARRSVPGVTVHTVGTPADLRLVADALVGLRVAV